jgi:5-methylcytosine-specific restriction endonuclease McrA
MQAPGCGVKKHQIFEHSSDYLFNMSALTRKEARKIWRNSIKEAWSNRCAYCGKPPIDDSSLTIDHVKPRCKGGEDRTSNAIPACSSCNLGKGSENWIQWYKRQEFYKIENEVRIKMWLKSNLSDFVEWNEYHMMPSTASSSA